MVIVTPEIVRPIPADQKLPELTYPQPFLPLNSDDPDAHPGNGQDRPVPVKPPRETMPLEELIEQRKEGQPAPAPTTAPYMLMPVQTEQPDRRPLPARRGAGQTAGGGK